MEIPCGHVFVLLTIIHCLHSKSVINQSDHFSSSSTSLSPLPCALWVISGWTGHAGYIFIIESPGNEEMGKGSFVFVILIIVIWGNKLTQLTFFYYIGINNIIIIEDMVV